MQKDKNGRGGNRRNDRQGGRDKVIPLDDSKMGDLLEKSFKTYLQEWEEKEDEGEYGEEEEKRRPKKDPEPDYSLYKRLFSDNGKKTDKILYQLITRLFFDTEESKLKHYLPDYLILLF